MLALPDDRAAEAAGHGDTDGKVTLVHSGANLQCKAASQTYSDRARLAICSVYN